MSYLIIAIIVIIISTIIETFCCPETNWGNKYENKNANVNVNVNESEHDKDRGLLEGGKKQLIFGVADLILALLLVRKCASELILSSIKLAHRIFYTHFYSCFSRYMLKPFA